jgi:hypothetical protein
MATGCKTWNCPWCSREGFLIGSALARPRPLIEQLGLITLLARGTPTLQQEALSRFEKLVNLVVSTGGE